MRISTARRRVRTALIVIAAIVVVVLAAGCGSKSSSQNIPGATGVSTSLPTTTGPPAKTRHVGLTLAKLRTYVGKVKHPVYWVGPMKNATYEVTYTPGGNFSVRYLAAGSKLGTKNYIVSVSTEPVFHGYDLLKQLTVENGMHAVHAKKPAVAVTSEAYPQSIRLAFPSKDYQIEVISPSVARVKHLVATGSVQPIS